MPNSAKKSLKIFISLIILVAIVAGFLLYWQHSELYPSTDDAYVDANIIHIAPQVSGPVSRIDVQNYQPIKKGQLLFTIDPRPFVIAVNSAKASIAESQSTLKLAQENAKRMLPLVATNQLSKQEGDQVVDKEQVAKAELSAATNRLKQAELNLSYTSVTAPANGILVNFTVRQGNMLEAGQPLFDIVENNQWWVNANFKETQLKRILQGQPATITTDLYPNHVYHGVIKFISPGSGSAFSILPPENATGNWVKVTQRFPIKVMITDAGAKFPLRVGASAAVSVNTTVK